MSYPPYGGGYPPAPGGYPPQPGYPPAGGMPQPGYPSMGGYPGYPPAPGGGGGIGFEAAATSATSGYPPAPGGYPPAPGGYPPAPGGYPPAPGGYGAPPQPGYGAPPQPGYGAPQPGYGAPPPQPGYGAPPPQPGYGAPPQPGYGAPPQQPPYGAQQPAYGGGAYPMGQTGPPNAPGQAYAGAPVTVPTSSNLYAPAPSTGGTSPRASPKPSPRQTHAAAPAAAAAATPPVQQFQGTVKAKPGFNAMDEAEILRKAMKGFGTDEKAIITVLTTLTNAERVKVESAFKQMYGKDLIKDLKSELGGKLERVTLALMTPAALYDAKHLRQAMKGLGTDEATLIEIMSSRTNEQIHAIKAAYKTEMKRDLEADLMSETSGHFKRLLVSLCNGGRDETSAPDRARAQNDAKALYQAGAARLGTDESSFNRVLCAQSPAQLQLVFEEYHRATGKSIEQAIKSEMSGDLEDGFLAIIACMKDRPGYFASRLYYSMKGAGTDDLTLIRVIVTRCEVDMVQIKEAFARNYGKSLVQFIKDDCSGDYERVLVALVQ